MKKFYVYIHTCPNGKKYVGVTGRDPESRWAEGRGYRYNKYFYSAILKYGWDNIKHEVFEVESEEEMYRKEVELISFYHSNDPNFGYNHSVGGEYGNLGCIRSEEFRKHRSEAQKEKWLNPEYRKYMSEAQKEKWTDLDYRRKKSEAYKKNNSDPEVRRKKSEAIKKKWLDPGYLKKQSEARKGKPRSEEFRKKISLAKKGKPRSEETKRRVSEALKGKPKPRVKIKLQDGTIVEVSKNIIVRDYVNKGKKFEYVS